MPIILAALITGLFHFTTASAADPIYTGLFSSTAVGGYDPVAYFTQGEPVQGSKEYTTDHEGAEWRFSSAENRDLFIANPSAYAPQYGGYCAWAVAEGKLAKGDPSYWTIVDGKLYLNYDRKVQETWETDIPGFIMKADANWPDILD
ncbi:YHS domain-containing (seleno)protein [Aquisalinus luteolus]|uniref:YHS domain-containing (seleno)protein n=1 Tax=Aquisalinus luteolus TaxID=1566827 RepID=UPI001981C7D4|nr:YHS domain-containing (seleno)protein [Aquisalinus luteolus]